MIHKASYSDDDLDTIARLISRGVDVTGIIDDQVSVSV